MALNVFVKTFISKPAREVAAYAFEPNNDPIWIGGITEAVLLTERPVGIGTRVRRIAKFMSRTIDYILEVVEFEPELKMVMQSIKSPFPMTVTYQFDEDVKGGTLAQLRVEGSSKSFYGIADYFMAPMVRRNLKRDLKRLKAICESS